VDILHWLLDHGADMNLQNKSLFAPIHGVVQSGEIEALKMLIEYNIDVHIRSVYGISLLHLAAIAWTQHNQVDVMQVLLDHGANPNARDDDNATPLHHSSWWEKDNITGRKGTVEGTRWLLKHGAIIDAEDNEGRTPLQLALDHGRDDIAACLKEHGATR
jgi:ankyrin repeat protein